MHAAVKSWCLSAAQSYRERHDSVTDGANHPSGICELPRCPEVVRDALAPLPSYYRPDGGYKGGYKFSRNISTDTECGYLQRAEWLEKFAES